MGTFNAYVGPYDGGGGPQRVQVLYPSAFERRQQQLRTHRERQSFPGLIKHAPVT